MHQKLYRFFTGYGYAFTVLAIVFIFSGYSIFIQTNTLGITVSGDRSELTCSSDIPIYSKKNAADFLKNDLFEYEDISLKSIICTVDNLYDGSKEDKQAVSDFIEQKLSFWPVRRSDIEEYFMKKIYISQSEQD